ncbi:hypothetical protein ACQVTQ_02770, partial [Bacillus mycoides]
KKMKPVRVYFVCSILRGLYCLKVFSFQLMKNCGASTLKLMGMGMLQQLQNCQRKKKKRKKSK